MAVQVDIQTPHGLTVQQAYVKVNSVGGSKQNAVIELFYYVNQEASVNGLEPLMRTYHEFVPSVDNNADNFIKQAYTFVKTLPEFEAAIDLLDEGQVA